MRRQKNTMIIRLIAWTASVAVLFAALFLLGHPGAFDQYIRCTQFFEKAVPETSDGSRMTLHFIDVGQADCTLIECGGRYMLVDGGNNDDGKLVTSYLKSAGVETLDYVIGTHPHEDHVGGLDHVIEQFDVKTLILPDVSYDSKTYKDVLHAAADKNIAPVTAKAGQKYSLSEHASFELVAPCADYGDDLNNWSVGLRMTHGKNHVLMCGDAEAASEADMLASGNRLSSELLKVSHHGSSTSTTEAFLDVVDPEYAVIMCGKNNEYGHPHAETLKRFAGRDITVYRTDELGTITAVSDGEDFVFGASGR